MRAGWLTGFALVVMTTSAPTSAAEPGSTEYMLEACQGPATADKSIVCPYFVRGFIEGIQTAWFWDKDGICIPDTVTTKQAMAVFVQWANTHPEKWNQRDAKSLGSALLEAFPCIRPENS